MSELTEFEEARRRRRRKKNWRRTKKLAIVLAVVAVIGITVFAGGQLGWGSHDEPRGLAAGGQGASPLRWTGRKQGSSSG